METSAITTGGLTGVAVFAGLALLRLLFGHDRDMLRLWRETSESQAQQISELLRTTNKLRTQLVRERDHCDRRITAVRQELEAEIADLRSQLGLPKERAR